MVSKAKVKKYGKMVLGAGLLLMGAGAVRKFYKEYVEPHLPGKVKEVSQKYL